MSAMTLTLRLARPEDAEACGEICFEAFKSIAQAHNFPPDFPSVELAREIIARLIAHHGFHGVVAELDGRIVGSNFLDERGAVAGIGPITVHPSAQNGGVGQRLMAHVLERARAPRFRGVRLVQAAYHNRSLCLYSKLGFDARAPLSLMQGPPIGITLPGRTVRPARTEDLDDCNRLCERVHGHHRGGELKDAIANGTASLVERDGRIAGYATVIALFGHAVGGHNADLKALIAAAPAFGGPGFLLPTTNGELLRWCLAHGLKVVQPMTLMTMGFYQEPAGPYLPSIYL